MLSHQALRGMEGAASKIIRNVVILVAMEVEARPMINHFGLELDEKRFPATAPAKCYSGKHKDAQIHIVINGKCSRFGVDNVGTVAAGLAAWLALDAFQPDLLINAGTAGGFRKKGAAIGDVFVSDGIRNHDRRIPIPGFTEWGIGDHKTMPTPHLCAALGFKKGVVTTGNSLDHTPHDDVMMDANDASVKDMEAAAIAWVCEQHHNTPLFCLKVVTDIVDGDKPTEVEFLENLGAAARSLQDAMPKTLDFVIGRRLDEL